MIFTGADVIISGLVSGIVATAVMTVTEIPSWRKWGLAEVFEWHENQLLSSRLFHIPTEKISFKYIFLLHFLNGSLAGIAFPLILSILNIPIKQDYTLILSVGYGFVLWIATLVPDTQADNRISCVRSQVRPFTFNCQSYRSSDIRIGIRYCNNDNDKLLTFQIGEIIKI